MAITRQSQLKWSQLKVGLLVLAAVTILVIMIMNLEEGMGVITSQTKFHAIVDHTQGLKVGGPVRMNGVDIGNVRDVAIAQDSPKVEVTFSVKESVAPHIREDASISIQPMGLLGDKFLEVLPGKAPKPLPPGAVLYGQAEAELTGLATNATATMDQIQTTITDMQKILLSISQGQGTAGKLVTDPALYDKSKQVMDKLDVVSEKSIALLGKVERGQGTIGSLMADKELYNRANKAIQDLNELATRLNNQNGTLGKLASDPSLYKRLDSLTSRGEQLLNRVENGEGTVGKLMTRDDLYSRADKLLSDVEQLLDDVKKHPTKYFKFSVF